MIAGVALEDWKLPVFRKRLTEAGFKYEDGGEFTPGITVLKVTTDDPAKLQIVLQQCQRECRRG